MASKFDQIAEALLETLLTADQAKVRDLALLLCDYEETYHRTWRDLMKIPAFVKLTDAIQEAGASANYGMDS